VLVVKEETSIEMNVVWLADWKLADWKPADAARDDGSPTVVASGTIELVLLSVYLDIELAKLPDKEERVWEPVGVKVPADEVGVGVGEPKALVVREVELLVAVILAKDEVLAVSVSDFVVAESVRVAPSPVDCTSGLDEVALFPGERTPFGLPVVMLADELPDD
jgi:hypothetical protein